MEKLKRKVFYEEFLLLNFVNANNYKVVAITENEEFGLSLWYKES